MHIIYLHGFNSAATGSTTVDKLIEAFGPDNVHAPDLSHIPNEAILQISNLLERFDDLSHITIVGNALSAFYANYFSKLYELKAILINPLTDPLVTCKRFLGPNRNPKTHELYTFEPEHLRQLKQYYVDPTQPPMMPTIVEVNEGIDDNHLDLQRTVDHYEGTCTIKVYEGGSQQFDHVKELIEDLRLLDHIMYE